MSWWRKIKTIKQTSIERYQEGRSACWSRSKLKLWSGEEEDGALGTGFDPRPGNQALVETENAAASINCLESFGQRLSTVGGKLCLDDLEGLAKRGDFKQIESYIIDIVRRSWKAELQAVSDNLLAPRARFLYEMGFFLRGALGSGTVSSAGAIVQLCIWDVSEKGRRKRGRNDEARASTLKISVKETRIGHLWLSSTAVVFPALESLPLLGASQSHQHNPTVGALSFAFGICHRSEYPSRLKFRRYLQIRFLWYLQTASY